MAPLITRVDGFDLCCSLRSKSLHRSYWLDGERIVKNPAVPVQQKVVTNNFTARVERKNGHLDQKRRQQTFPKAFETLPVLHLTTTGTTSRSPACLPGRWPHTPEDRF